MSLNAILVATAVFLGSGVAAEAEDITGIWATGAEGGKVEIYRCDGGVCGRVVDAAALRSNPDQRDVRNSDRSLRDRRLRGLVVLHDFTGGPREWRGGPVYDPQSGDGARHGYLRLRGDGRLEVKGCVAFFCRTRVWTRLD